MKLFEKIKTTNYKHLKICGMKIYKKYLNENLITSVILFGLIKKEKFHKYEIKKIFICNFCIYSTKNEYKILNDLYNQKAQLNYISDKNLFNLTVQKHHEKIFPKFKNIHKDKTGIIIGTGPSVKYLKIINNAILFGVNSAFKIKNISLDYLFAIDFSRIKDLYKELKIKEFIKFFGQGNLPYPHIYYDKKRHIPEYIIEECTNAYKYYFDLRNYSTINANIETQALPDFTSCVFSAAYFAIYTGINVLYIAGCDCVANGYFDKSPQERQFNEKKLINGWQTLYNWKTIFYPQCKFISINPIGLKNMFDKDVYTQTYINEHPELLKEKIEII